MKKIVYGVAGIIAALALVGCFDGTVHDSCEGTSPPSPLSVHDISAKYIGDWEGESSWVYAADLDLRQAYSPEEVNIRLAASNRYSAQQPERLWSFSLVQKAYACSLAPASYEHYIDSIRIFVGSTSNESTAEGTELTEQMMVVADHLHDTGDLPLEQWNELDLEQVNIWNRQDQLAVIAFKNGTHLPTGSYEFHLMVELENGDLFEMTTAAITIE